MNTTQQPEARIEAIISKACGQYRTGDSYTFEEVWNCIEAALASANVKVGSVPVGFRTRVPGFDWTPWITDDQATIDKAINDAHDHGFEGEALFVASADPAEAPLNDARVNLEHTMWRIATHGEPQISVTDDADEVRAAIAGAERKALEYGLQRGYALASASTVPTEAEPDATLTAEARAFLYPDVSDLVASQHAGGAARYLCTPNAGGEGVVIDRAPDSFELRECAIVELRADEPSVVALVQNAIRNASCGGDILRCAQTAARAIVPLFAGAAAADQAAVTGREAFAWKDDPANTGVGPYCQPGDSRAPYWLLMFDDADRGIAFYESEKEGREAFAHSEGRGWNCWLFSPTPRVASQAEVTSEDTVRKIFAAAGSNAWFASDPLSAAEVVRVARATITTGPVQAESMDEG
ncbi:hypothetical protein KTE91_28970 [Burkholderia multivorans]|uniref:hypothetical protein n=1 Tax=Burkholderia multivorans TaxID=87883 RepID=UPI001C23F227|nr:hypothetical protein [Burkholderia multivorans]MBU9439117.1 hypothetical protein [Burkholderia multivorans]